MKKTILNSIFAIGLLAAHSASANVKCTGSHVGMPDTSTQVSIIKSNGLLGFATNFGLGINISNIQVKMVPTSAALIFKDIQSNGKNFKLTIPNKSHNKSVLTIPNKQPIMVSCKPEIPGI